MSHASQSVALQSGNQVFTSLRHRNFRLLWFGLLIALTGYWVQIVAQGWLVLELSNSPLLLGVVSAAGSIPILFFSLPAGALADRVDRRKLILITRGLLSLLIAIQAFLTITGTITVWGVAILAGLSGIVFAFDIPVRMALVPALVDQDDLMNAIALNSAVFNGTRIVGPAIAGVLVSLIGTGGCFLITALSYFGLMAMIWVMKVPPVDPSAGENSLFRNIIEGLTFIRGSWLISTLMVINTVQAVFGMTYFMLMPVFARDVLGVGAQGLGVLMAATGVGALAGALIVASLGNFRGQGWVVLGGFFVSGIMLSLFAASTWYPGALIALALVGVVATVFATVANTILQSNIPDELQGRVMSVLTLTWGLTPLGSLFAGGIANSYGAPAAVIVGAVICMVCSVAVGFVRPDFLKV